MKLLVVTHAPTLNNKGRLSSYAPYVNEMDLWFKLVDSVAILSPNGYPESILEKEFEYQQLKLYEIPFIKIQTFAEGFRFLIILPSVFFKFMQSFYWADHIHLRCPGNIGLLGCLIQMFFPSKPKTAKYAGNWDPQAKQPWSYRFQKWILSNTFLTRNMQVLVYGDWPEQSKNILPFFTASFSEEEKSGVPKKVFSERFTFLFVGNLVEGKRPLEAIRLVEKLSIRNKKNPDQEIHFRLDIYGDGPERNRLETYVRENKLEQLINFKGSRPLKELKQAYRKAHFVVLVSRSEGWPKAIAEGMFFGCIPIATPVSCVPWMLNYGSRGVLLEGFRQQLRMSGQRKEGRGQNVVKIAQLLADQEEMKRMSEEAKKWSQQYTLEMFEEAIQEVLFKSNKNRIIETGKFSPAPFRACPDSSGDGAKRGKSKK